MRRLRGALMGGLLAGLEACGPSIPVPPAAPQPATAFVTVSYPPPEVRPETLPPKPAASAVWVDGEWVWDGSAWAWRSGAWVEPPAGGRYAPWTLRVRPDATLEFAPGAWRDAEGRPLLGARILARAMGGESEEGASGCR